MTSGDSLDQPILTIAGEKVAIGPNRRDLVGLYNRWFNDLEVMSHFADGPLTPDTRETTEARYERISKTETTASFTVYERTTLRPIGMTDLEHIDLLTR